MHLRALLAVLLASSMAEAQLSLSSAVVKKMVNVSTQSSLRDIGSCPPGSIECVGFCCPSGDICSTIYPLCLKCPAGDFLCPDQSGCCPYGRTCQGDYCVANNAGSSSGGSSSLPSWAISLIVIVPLSCAIGICRYNIQRAKESADAYSSIGTNNPVRSATQQAAPAAPPSYQAAAYQGGVGGVGSSQYIVK
jgi:hypothetical protein